MSNESRRTECQDCHWFVWSDGTIEYKRDDIGYCFHNPPVVVPHRDGVTTERPVVAAQDMACAQFRAAL